MAARQEKIISFAEDLAVLLNSGTDLDASLDIIASAHTEGEFKSVLLDLRSRIRDGQALSVAMVEHSEWFDHYYVGMLKSGEVSAQLPSTLERLAAQLENDQELESQINSALVYPSILLVAMALSLVMILGVILPRLTGLFESLSGDLSPAASTLLALGNFINNWGAIILFVMIALPLLLWQFRTQLNVKNRCTSYLKKVPAIGRLFNQVEFARFTATMSSLLGAGLQQAQALEISAHGFSHDGRREQIARVISKVKEGQALSLALTELDGFSELHTASIASGERGGQLAETFGVLSSRLQKEFSKRAQRMAMLVEPVMIILLGLIIGFVVYAVFSAMQTVGDFPL